MSSLDLSHPALQVHVEPGLLHLVALQQRAVSLSKLASLAEELEEKEQSSDSDCSSSHFLSITSTPHEISVLTSNEGLARAIELEAGTREKQEQEKQQPPMMAPTTQWRALKIAGPLDLTMVGVMHAFTTALTQAQVSILAISTYLTDYILVKEDALDQATEALEKAGWHVKKP